MSTILNNYNTTKNVFDNLLAASPTNNASNHCIRKWAWLLDMSEIEPGNSAVLGGNKLVFYGVHYTAIVFILISLTSCTSVIINVFRNSKNRKNWDFSDRFPLYLAISDGLWGLSNLSGDHVILIIRQLFPEKHVATMLAVNVFFFFAYQQLMSAGLSLYTYMKVVRRVSLDLGHWEWKLHAIVVAFVLCNVALYCYVGALGNAGFWFLADLNTNWGKLMGVNICLTCTVHALLTLVAYRAIQKVITNQKRVVSTHIQPLSSSFDMDPDWSKPTNGGTRQASSQSCRTTTHRNNSCRIIQPRYHSTATNCLTTFVYISICLYFPFAVTAWLYLTFGFFGFIEPTTAFIVVIAANSGGWVNMWGYFHNRKLKEMRRKIVVNNIKANILSSSSSSV